MTSMPTIVPTVQPRVTSTLQQAASWELVVASILLFILVVVRGLIMSGVMKLGSGEHGNSGYIMGFFRGIKQAFTGENSGWHFGLYLVIFALVLSATVLFFV